MAAAKGRRSPLPGAVGPGARSDHLDLLARQDGIHGRAGQSTADRATLLITHDLDGLAEADEIVVLGHRRVLERGTHTWLPGARGYYARMGAAAAAAGEPAGAVAGTAERTLL